MYDKNLKQTTNAVKVYLDRKKKHTNAQWASITHGLSPDLNNIEKAWILLTKKGIKGR